MGEIRDHYPRLVWKPYLPDRLRLRIVRDEQPCTDQQYRWTVALALAGLSVYGGTIWWAVSSL